MMKNNLFLISGSIAAEVTCTHVQQNCRPTYQALEVYSWEDERKGTVMQRIISRLQMIDNATTVADVFKSCCII